VSVEKVLKEYINLVFVIPAKARTGTGQACAVNPVFTATKNILMDFCFPVCPRIPSLRGIRCTVDDKAIYIIPEINEIGASG